MLLGLSARVSVAPVGRGEPYAPPAKALSAVLVSEVAVARDAGAPLVNRHPMYRVARISATVATLKRVHVGCFIFHAVGTECADGGAVAWSWARMCGAFSCSFGAAGTGCANASVLSGTHWLPGGTMAGAPGACGVACGSATGPVWLLQEMRGAGCLLSYPQIAMSASAAVLLD